MSELLASPNYWRQVGLVPPEILRNKPIHIIGVGATGSYVAYILAKMGAPEIHLYDFDVVEDHNLPNQMFRLKDVGRSKIEAMAEIILEATGTKVVVHDAAVTSALNTQRDFSGVVFLLVDSMDVRVDIWKLLRYNLKVDFMIETRMAIDNGRLYAISPRILDDIELWEGSLYSSEEAEEPACNNRALAPTAGYIASLAVWQFVKHCLNEKVEREIICSFRPLVLLDPAAYAGV